MDKLAVLCSFPDCRCRRKHEGSGLCVRHRRMQLAGQELKPLRRYERATSTTCSGPQCDRPVDSRGLCQNHAKQQLRTGRTWAFADGRGKTLRERWAGLSQAERDRRLSAMQEGRRAAYYSDEWQQRQSDAHRAAWPKQKAQLAERVRQCRCCGEAFRPESWRQLFCSRSCRTLANRVRRHDISVDQFRQLLTTQAGACALCGGNRRGFGKGADLHVDHDHATGQVRGLLCGNCNTAIGRFGDDPVKLRRAADYLERARS